MSIEQVIGGGILLLFYGTGLWMIFCCVICGLAAVYLVIREWGKPEPEGGYITLSTEDEEDED